MKEEEERMYVWWVVSNGVGVVGVGVQGVDVSTTKQPTHND